MHSDPEKRLSIGTEQAMKTAVEEIQLFLNEAFRRGFEVRSILLGQGLMDLAKRFLCREAKARLRFDSPTPQHPLIFPSSSWALKDGDLLLQRENVASVFSMQLLQEFDAIWSLTNA